MTKGEAVEVRIHWAHGADPEWFRGYTYDRTEPSGDIIVRHTAGLYQGMETRYAADSVRRSTRG